MKNAKTVLLVVAIAAFGVLGAGLYAQFVERMLPCPWCVIQRYIFAAIGIIALITAFAPARFTRIGAGLGMLTAMGGIGAASWLMWVQAHPTVSCGIDPLETSLNTIFTARVLPFLFKADGLCTTEYPPILGLSVPQWALVWFAIFMVSLGWTAFKRNR
jgi:disulfide bond formation protein DsbB